MQDVTKIGCVLLIRQGDTLLLGKRKNCFGAGSWGLPGGHLEFNERMIDAVIRKAKEEINLDILPEHLELVAIHDGVATAAELESGKGHHVQVGFAYNGPAVAPQNMEPDRCEELCFFPITALPDNILVSHQPVVEQFQQQKLYAQD